MSADAAVGRLVLVLVCPLAVELAALADRLSWPVTVIDPESARLDAEPVPYARTCLTVEQARLDAECDVLVCDPDREELDGLVADVLAGPAVRRLQVVGDTGQDQTVPEVALATMAALLAARRRPVRPPVPPFTEQTARQKVQAAEDAWNSRDPARVAAAYTPDTIWRNRSEFLTGREQVEQFLVRKWQREQDYALRKALWAFTDDRIAVRFQYEWRDDQGQWWRSYGNENWEFDGEGLMRRREASIDDVAIAEGARRIFGPRSEQEQGADLPLA